MTKVQNTYDCRKATANSRPNKRIKAKIGKSVKETNKRLEECNVRSPAPAITCKRIWPAIKLAPNLRPKLKALAI